MFSHGLDKYIRWIIIKYESSVHLLCIDREAIYYLLFLKTTV